MQKTVLSLGKSKFDILLGNAFRWTKEERDHPVCCHHLVERAASVMEWDASVPKAFGSLQIGRGTINAEWYMGVFQQRMLVQVTSVSGLVYFSKTMSN